MSGRRVRARSAVAVSLAAAFHVLLLLCILAWRPAAAPMLGAVEVSLVSAAGLSPTPAPAAPDKIDLVSPDPIVAPPAALVAPNEPDTGSAIKLRPMPLLNPSTPLPTSLLNAAQGGASAIPVPSKAAAAPQDVAQGGGKSCDILEALKQALQTTPAARGAISLIPPNARSVANAVLLWDGRWIDAPAVGGLSALAPIQTTVVQTLDRAPPACRAELVRGPRLIAVGDARDTIVLAFGSGEWRWADVVATTSTPQLP